MLNQSNLVGALGMSHGGSYSRGGDRLAKFVAQERLKSFTSADLVDRTVRPIKFKTPAGNVAYGYEATVLADICEAVLAARKAGKLMKQQEQGLRSSISPVAIRMTWTALPITSAGRLAPLGVFGIA